MKSIENTSVVGVRIAEIIVEISMAYFLFDERNLLETTPILDNKNIISGYSKIIPKLKIKELKKDRVSLILGKAIIDSDEYSFKSILKVNGATNLKHRKAPRKKSAVPRIITIKEILFFFFYSPGPINAQTS